MPLEELVRQSDGLVVRCLRNLGPYENNIFLVSDADSGEGYVLDAGYEPRQIANASAGLSAIDYCVCIEEIARVDPAVALSVAAHNGLCTAHIALVGNAEQKQTYLVPLARGEKLGAWALTESTSGSDAAGMVKSLAACLSVDPTARPSAAAVAQALAA